jgi:hypothetical protein
MKRLAKIVERLALRSKVPAFIFSLLILVLPLSSCGTSSSEVTTAQQADKLVGTQGELISIQSDNVNAAGYNEASLVMTVQFRNGALYEYYQVPSDLWISFIAAQPHPWSEVGYPRLVQGGVSQT